MDQDGYLPKKVLACPSPHLRLKTADWLPAQEE